MPSSAEPSKLAEEKAVMFGEIALQPDYLRANAGPMVLRAREALSGRPIADSGGAFAVGCGDSFCAALAARNYFMARTGRWFEPAEALEFSAYLVAALPVASMVFGVSNSGTVSRTIEAVRRARERGAWTFAITVGSTNELARTAESLIEVNAVPNIKRRADGSTLVTPGTLTYLASLLGLYVAAIALGERLGALSAAGVVDAVAELEGVANVMAAAAPGLNVALAELAPTLAPDRSLIVLGGGPNYATAYYAMAKLYEAVQWPVHHAQVEEWAHEHFFITGPTTDTIVIAPPGATRTRALEQAGAAREMGSRTIVLGARSDAAARTAADVFIELPDDIPEALTPLIYKLPFEYLAAHLAQQSGSSFFNFADPLRQHVNFRQISASTSDAGPPAAGR